MRLSEREISVITDAVANRFGPHACLYLFGSRTNDALKGGDIDLFVDLPEVDHETVHHSCQTIADIQLQLGEQKIDLIVRHPDLTNQPIFHEALRHGIQLI